MKKFIAILCVGLLFAACTQEDLLSETELEGKVTVSPPPPPPSAELLDDEIEEKNADNK